MKREGEGVITTGGVLGSGRVIIGSHLFNQAPLPTGFFKKKLSRDKKRNFRLIISRRG